jgi:hypothetical protein
MGCADLKRDSGYSVGTRSEPFLIPFLEALSYFRPVSKIQPRKQKRSVQNGIRYQDGTGFSCPAFTPTNAASSGHLIKHHKTIQLYHGHMVHKKRRDSTLASGRVSAEHDHHTSLWGLRARYVFKMLQRQKAGLQAGVRRQGREKVTLRRRDAWELARREMENHLSLLPDLGTRRCRFPSFVADLRSSSSVP